MKKGKILISFIFIILMIIFDQLTKILVINNLSVNESFIIISNFFKFCYIKNYGISFGIFSGKSIMIVLLTIIIIGYMIYENIKNESSKLLNVSTLLILGGAFGNLYDRIFRGYVVDYVSFTIFGNEMAIFNLADIFITFGVIIYIVCLFMEGNYGKNSSKERK